MTKQEIENLIRNLGQEIVRVQVGEEQEASLVRLKEIAKVYNGEDKIISFKDVVARVKANIGKVKIKSGWSKLDSIVKGFRFKQNIIISALPKSGKTSFVMDLTIKLEEYNPLWFAFEESVDELVEKYLEREQKPPVAYAPKMNKDKTVAWMEEKLIESIAKYGTKVMMIDQLDFINHRRADNEHLRIAQTMRDLKELAKKWDVTIFTICHLRKAPVGQQPTSEDLRGSSAIAGEADMIILLWRESKREDGQVIKTNNINISVQENRTGGTGNVKMVYDNGRFYEQEWDSEIEQQALELKNF